jgi:hypothetical protein
MCASGMLRLKTERFDYVDYYPEEENRFQFQVWAQLAEQYPCVKYTHKPLYILPSRSITATAYLLHIPQTQTTFRKEWLTDDVISIAASIVQKVESEAREQSEIIYRGHIAKTPMLSLSFAALSDALQEAGCTDDELIHLYQNVQDALSDALQEAGCTDDELIHLYQNVQDALPARRKTINEYLFLPSLIVNAVLKRRRKEAITNVK